MVTKLTVMSMTLTLPKKPKESVFRFHSLKNLKKTNAFMYLFSPETSNYLSENLSMKSKFSEKKSGTVPKNSPPDF